MATLKYKDSNGNYQPIVGVNVQNQVVQTTGQSTTAVMSQKAVSDLVPAQASSSNQLADKDFVNSSITTATATYRGSYNLVSDLSLTISASHGQIETALNTAATGADNNDYCFVQIPTADATPTEIASVERYKHNGTTWSYEYAINNSGLTAAQWAAVNSGITSGLVGKLGQLTSNPQNSIAALFGMDANGDWQNITPANLASVLSVIQVKSKLISNTQSEKSGDSWLIPTGLSYMDRTQCVFFRCIDRSGWTFSFVAKAGSWYIKVDDVSSDPGGFAGTLYYI